MSSFGPPGGAPHPSLPQRPPPSSGAAPYHGQSGTQPGQMRPGFSHTVGRGGGGGGGGYQHNGGYNSYAQESYGPATGPSADPIYGASYGAAAVVMGAPQIRNPFPTPAQRQQQAAFEETPEMAAQIASWQGAYMPKENNNSANNGAGYGYGYGGASASTQYAAAGSYGPVGPVGPAGPVHGGGGVGGAATAATAEPSHAAHGHGPEREKTVYRSGGGKTWADDSLLEWDPSHLRLFVGNLAGEVTDDTLLKAFSRWKSVQKALVKRDKWTQKSRGYGFVSFSDADDFFQAAKEMNGKYIGSHPVVVRKSKTEIKVAPVKGDKKKRGGGGGSNGGNGSKGGNGNNKKKAGSGGDHGRREYEPAFGPVAAGVHKPGQKTKGGLKLLG